jgi:RHS repeat-associated protein
VVSAQDYYAFGATMPSRSWQDTDYERYRYSFNGKEDDEDFQDYGGMRAYSKKSDVFWSVDPIGQDYPQYSPYHFAGRSPIANIDLDGLEPLKRTEQLTLTSEKGISKDFNVITIDIRVFVVITEQWDKGLGKEPKNRVKSSYTQENAAAIQNSLPKEFNSMQKVSNQTKLMLYF